MGGNSHLLCPCGCKKRKERGKNEPTQKHTDYRSRGVVPVYVSVAGLSDDRQLLSEKVAVFSGGASGVGFSHAHCLRVCALHGDLLLGQ